jgi:hypothetical protein
MWTRVAGMEVCYVNAIFQPPTIVFYKSVKDYEEDKPVAVYIIAPQGLEGRAESIAVATTLKYKEAEVRVLKGRKTIEKVMKLCLKARRVVSPKVW